MKRYILFTDEELDDMIHGCEVELHAHGETLYFMSKEHFAQLAGANDDQYPDCFGKYYGKFPKPCEDGNAGLCPYCRECQQDDPNY